MLHWRDSPDMSIGGLALKDLRGLHAALLAKLERGQPREHGNRPGQAGCPGRLTLPVRRAQTLPRRRCRASARIASPSASRAALLHVGQVGLVRLDAGRGRRGGLVLAGREAAPGALPLVGDRGVGREAGLGLVPVRAPERHPDPGRGLAALRLAHRASAYPASADRVATAHRSPLIAVPSHQPRPPTEGPPVAGYSISPSRPPARAGNAADRTDARFESAAV